MTDYDPNYIPKKSYALIGQKAIVLNTKGEILVLQRSKKAGAEGKWSLPGGGLDDGEDPIKSIKREIEEETKVKISNIQPFSLRSYKEDGDFIVIIGYQCKAMSDKLELNWEHDDYNWVSKEKALELDLTEDARFFIEKF